MMLLPHHARLLAASAISGAVAEARGYRSVTTKAELTRLGFSGRQARVPALLVPVWGVTGEIALHQIRPDEPRFDQRGKTVKYETAAGSRMVVDVHPAVRARLADPHIPLWVTEGVRKGDSAVTAGLACVALLGVWNWRGTNEHGGKVALADFESIALNGREVFIAFDSDAVTKAEVGLALRRLREFLASRKARVHTVRLPAGAGGAKTGLDDYLAAGHSVDELRALLATAPEAVASTIPPGPSDPPDVYVRLGARLLAEISTAPPPPLLIERLDPEGHTILYGTGGVGKGVLATFWIVRLVGDGAKVLILDYENHPNEWARRVMGLGGRDVLARVTHVAPLTAPWQGDRGPLWEQTTEIRELAHAMGTTYLVIDSIVTACAGLDPTKPEAAALYAGGLEYIGLPALSLGHVNRADDMRYPFGSIFWHNLARTTWSLKRNGERAILQHQKHNNYAALGRFIVQTTWRGDLLGEVSEVAYGGFLADRIEDALEGGALTVADILEKLNADLEEDEDPLKADSVRTAMRRGIKATARRPQRFTVDGSGEGATYRRVET
jgi:hypothetical protein